MRSTFHGLETSKRALYTQQSALYTTGHNISNANTEGYTRQRVNMKATNPLENPAWTRSTAPGQLGTGVDAASIDRIRESFLDDQYRNESQAFGDWSIQRDTLEKLESIVNEPSDTGLRKVIEEFWNAWQTLSQDPDNPTPRGVLKERALALAETFNYTAQKLSDLSADLTKDISLKTTEANTLISQIAGLNDQILKIETLGSQANDLRDQRDLLTDKLSEIINIRVTETNQGYTISMGTTELVNGNQITTVLDAANMVNYAASGDLIGGQIHGMIVSRDRYVAQYQQQLDTMIQTIATGEVTVTLPKGTLLPIGSVVNGVTIDATNQELTADTQVTVAGINGLHKLGYTLEEPLTAGTEFFTIKTGHTGLTAASVQLNPDIGDNVNLIAASARFYTDSGGTQHVLKGNNELALAIGSMRDLKFDFDPALSGGLSSGTIDEYFQSVVGQLGVQSQEAKRQASNQEILVDQVDERRQSVSGVSLDEEMSNMIKFQHAYNAAARMVTTIDQILDKVINGMGVVGR